MILLWPILSAGPLHPSLSLTRSPTGGSTCRVFPYLQPADTPQSRHLPCRPAVPGHPAPLLLPTGPTIMRRPLTHAPPLPLPLPPRPHGALQQLMAAAGTDAATTLPCPSPFPLCPIKDEQHLLSIPRPSPSLLSHHSAAAGAPPPEPRPRLDPLCQRFSLPSELPSEFPLASFSFR
jgi:hypothetical protein